MTSPQGIQLTFRILQEGCETAWEIMKASRWFNQFFLMSQLCVCQNLPFSHCSEKCSQASMVPLMLYVIALAFLYGSTWLVWAVNSCATTHPSSVSLRNGQKVRQLRGKFWILSCHVFTKLCLNTTATIRPSPLIPATLERVVHNKSITHSFKMKIKRASD